METRLRKSELPVSASGQSIDDVMSGFEKEFILNTLAQNRYSLNRTAEQLKISRHALRYRMTRLNIQTDHEEDSGLNTPKQTPQC
jgi:DNA-binding NtrC family response regulator